MEIKVKDKTTGKIYTNDMSSESTILEIHFCTSYTQVVVQDRFVSKFPTKDLILPPLGTEPSFIDMIATQNDNVGEWV